MAIKINHTYCTHVEVIYYSDNGYTLRCDDCGQMDDIAERACDIMLTHNFNHVDIASKDTGEILMMIERT